MKKINKLFILVLLSLLITTACTNNKPIEDDNINNGTETPAEDQSSDQDKAIRKFLELIIPEKKASDLGLYIKNNIKDVDQDDVEEMIHWLLVYQTETINSLNYKMTSPKYLEALNETMNGVLDPTKIDNIKDEDVRKDYQELVDGFMTIKRYEETPVVETNWKALNKLSPYVKDDLGKVFELYQRNQDYEYDREQLDVGAIAEDIIKTESILKNHKSDFIYSIANELYDLQLSTLFIGPEGNYLGFFLNKNEDEYKDIMKAKDNYTDSYLSKMILELDSEKYETPMDVYDLIDKKLQFGIESNNYLKIKEFKENNIKYLTFEMIMPNEKEKQNKINEILNSRMVDFFKEQIGPERDLTVSVYSNYQDKQYISYNGFVNFNDESEYPEEIYLYKTFDYINEKHITLEEYLGTNIDDLKKDLNSTLGIELNHTPEFQPFDNGVVIYLEGLEGLDRYFELSKRYLSKYLSLDELTKKY